MMPSPRSITATIGSTDQEFRRFNRRDRVLANDNTPGSPGYANKDFSPPPCVVADAPTTVQILALASSIASSR
jgi:hypothetical protein